MNYSIIKKKITIDEFSLLVRDVLECNGDVYIYQGKSSDSSQNPYFSFGLKVKSCISTNLGIQFDLQEGHILLNFKFPPSDAYQIEFIYDDDDGNSGYWVHFGIISIFFSMSPSNFCHLVEALEECMKLEAEKESLFNTECEESNNDMPEGFWTNIDN